MCQVSLLGRRQKYIVGAVLSVGLYFPCIVGCENVDRERSFQRFRAQEKEEEAIWKAAIAAVDFSRPQSDEPPSLGPLVLILIQDKTESSNHGDAVGADAAVKDYPDILRCRRSPDGKDWSFGQLHGGMWATWNGKKVPVEDCPAFDLEHVTEVVVIRELSSHLVGYYVKSGRLEGGFGGAAGVAGKASVTTIGVYVMSWPQKQFKAFKKFVGRPPAGYRDPSDPFLPRGYVVLPPPYAPDDCFDLDGFDDAREDAMRWLGMWDAYYKPRKGG